MQLSHLKGVVQFYGMIHQKVETAAQGFKNTSDNLKQQNLIDDVVNEPLIGAHRKKMRLLWL